MHIRKFLSRLLICILCLGCFCSSSFAEANLPNGEITEYGNWLNQENLNKYHDALSTDAAAFESQFRSGQTYLQPTTFVPIEVKLGLAFMQALSSLDYLLNISLVRFTIMFLFIMYAFWVVIQAYKMIREASDYKTVLYEIFKQGITIAIWVIILNYGPAKIFTLIITPILGLGVFLSDFILGSVAQTFNIDLPDTCAAIHQYVAANSGDKMLIEPDAAANIMCLPGRLSVYFYHATAAAFKWFVAGFSFTSGSLVQIVAGAVCVFIFIKCIFKYAFMTLGVVADLFLTLLMLPFTALAEALPSVKEQNYIGQVFDGLLGVFKTKKTADVIASFINVALYFVSLSIVIAICVALLSQIVSLSQTDGTSLDSMMTTILCGCLILFLADKADDLAKKIGGNVDNSFGTALQKNAKTLWTDTKNIASKVYQGFKKKK